MAIIVDQNISGDLEEKLGANVWWRPKIEKKELKKLSERRSFPGIYYTTMYWVVLVF